MSKAILVKESTLTEAGSKGKWRAKLIEGNKRGSSAFYPADVLERDGARAFPAGTKIFFDHPGLEEQWDRPERSVRDLVGVTSSEALYESDGLYADVTIFSSYQELVQEMAEHTGLSIRANGIVEEEEIDGEFMPVLKALTSSQSVDIVTEAGAGGKLVGLLESARSKESPKPKPPSPAKEDFDMTPEQLAAALAEANAPVIAALTALTEAQKPKAPEPEKLSYSEIDSKLTEAKIPAILRGKIFESVANGGDLDKAIVEAKEVVEAVRKDAEAEAKIVEGAVVNEGDTNLNESKTPAAQAASLINWG